MFSPREELCPGISIDSIYTSEELLGMNGAVMETETPPEVEPREDDTIRHKRQVGKARSLHSYVYISLLH